MVPKWARVTLKWEGSVHKRAEEIALPRRDNRKQRKSQANADDCCSRLAVSRRSCAMLLAEARDTGAVTTTQRICGMVLVPETRYLVFSRRTPRIETLAFIHQELVSNLLRGAVMLSP